MVLSVVPVLGTLNLSHDPPEYPYMFINHSDTYNDERHEQNVGASSSLHLFGSFLLRVEYFGSLPEHVTVHLWEAGEV